MQGSIVIIYNIPEINSTENIKIGRKELSRIFKQEIKMWNDPSLVALNPNINLPPQPILRVVRKDSSGTTDDFTKILKKFDSTWTAVGSLPNWPNATSNIFYVSGADAVSQSIQILPYSIAYNTYNSLLRVETNLALLQNQDGYFVNVSLDTNSVSESTQFNQYFSADITDLSGKDIYPMTILTYLLYFNKTTSNSSCDSQIKLYKYLKSYYTELGNQIMLQNNFHPMPSSIYRRIGLILDQMVCNDKLITSYLNVDYNPLIIGLSVGIGGSSLILFTVIFTIVVTVFCIRFTEKKMVESLI